MNRLILSIVPFWLVACSGDAQTDTDTTTTGDTGDSPGGLAIAGEYLDGFGTEHTVTDEAWTQQYPGYDPMVFAITGYDNSARWVVAQNDASNAYSANLWSRFDWTEADGHLWYCQSAYDAASEAEAQDTARPDDTDPATLGCGGFSWTDLTP